MGSSDRPRHFQGEERGTVGLSTTCKQGHELLVCLAQIDFHRP